MSKLSKPDLNKGSLFGYIKDAKSNSILEQLITWFEVDSENHNGRKRVIRNISYDLRSFLKYLADQWGFADRGTLCHALNYSYYPIKEINGTYKRELVHRYYFIWLHILHSVYRIPVEGNFIYDADSMPKYILSENGVGHDKTTDWSNTGVTLFNYDRSSRLHGPNKGHLKDAKEICKILQTLNLQSLKTSEWSFLISYWRAIRKPLGDIQDSLDVYELMDKGSVKIDPNYLKTYDHLHELIFNKIEALLRRKGNLRYNRYFSLVSRNLELSFIPQITIQEVNSSSKEAKLGGKDKLLCDKLNDFVFKSMPSSFDHIISCLKDYAGTDRFNTDEMCGFFLLISESHQYHFGLMDNAIHTEFYKYKTHGENAYWTPDFMILDDGVNQRSDLLERYNDNFKNLKDNKNSVRLNNLAAVVEITKLRYKAVISELEKVKEFQEKKNTIKLKAKRKVSKMAGAERALFKEMNDLHNKLNILHKYHIILKSELTELQQSADSLL